jgi:hypothetical protein
MRRDPVRGPLLRYRDREYKRRKLGITPDRYRYHAPREPQITLPPEPFRLWLEERIKRRGDLRELAQAIVGPDWTVSRRASIERCLQHVRNGTRVRVPLDIVDRALLVDGRGVRVTDLYPDSTDWHQAGTMRGE